MKRLVLFVVALVFVFCTTAMATEPMAAPTEQTVAAEKANTNVDEAKVKADAKKAKAKKAAEKKAAEAPAEASAK